MPIYAHAEDTSRIQQSDQLVDSGVADPANADLLTSALGMGSDVSDTSLEIIGEDCAVSQEEGVVRDDDYEMALRLQEEMDRDYSRQQQQQAERVVDQGAVHNYNAAAAPHAGAGAMDLSPDVISQQEEILRNIQAEKEGRGRHTSRGQGNNRSSRNSGCVVS